jgi:tRNA(Ile2) C34 agmatinyltransferase TiaS
MRKLKLNYYHCPFCGQEMKVESQPDGDSVIFQCPKCKARWYVNYIRDIPELTQIVEE